MNLRGLVDTRDLEPAYHMETGRVAESQYAVVVGMDVEKSLKAEEDIEPAVVVARDHYFVFDPDSIHLQMGEGSHLVAAGLVEKVLDLLLRNCEKP